MDVLILLKLGLLKVTFSRSEDVRLSSPSEMFSKIVVPKHSCLLNIIVNIRTAHFANHNHLQTKSSITHQVHLFFRALTLATFEDRTVLQWKHQNNMWNLFNPERSRRCPVKKGFLKISQNSLENTCTCACVCQKCFRLNFPKKIVYLFYRNPLVAASICCLIVVLSSDEACLWIMWNAYH